MYNMNNNMEDGTEDYKKFFSVLENERKQFVKSEKKKRKIKTKKMKNLFSSVKENIFYQLG